MYSKEELLDALHFAGFFPCYCSTKDKHFEETLRSPMDLAIVAAGDGTVAKVVTGLAGSGVPLAIIPLGTANNIARSLGIEGPPMELAETWQPDFLKRLTIGGARGPWGKRPFVEAVGVGLLAEALPRVGEEAYGPDKVKKGRDKLAKFLRKAKPIDTEIEIDGKKVKGDILAFEITNIKYVGPGLPIAPDAEPGDSLFDAICIRKDEREAMLDWLEAPQKKPFPLPLKQGSEISVSWEGTALRVDDKFYDAPKRAETVTAALDGGTVDVFVKKPPARARM
jgi:diacylglycerol kinase family enzyme